MRVAFVHTVNGVLDSFRRQVADTLPELDTFHVLNEALLQELLRGRDSAAVYAALTTELSIVEEMGAELIVMTCSSTSPGVDVARPRLGVPVLKIDDPMARRAVQSGSTVGLVCTATSTLEASTRLLHDHAAALDTTVTVEPVLLPAAYEALHAGRQTEHDHIVLEAARELAGRVDVLVLAQASLAHLQQPLAGRVSVPVLASPPLLLEELRARVETVA